MARESARMAACRSVLLEFGKTHGGVNALFLCGDHETAQFGPRRSEVPIMNAVLTEFEFVSNKWMARDEMIIFQAG
jgi:hypothetical protein